MQLERDGNLMDKVWLKNYSQGVPATIDPSLYQSLADFFFKTCEKFASNKAFYNLGQTITYAELEEKAKDVAAYYQQVLHLKKGDRIALMMPNVLQYPIAMFGSLIAGLIVVNVNPLYTARELAYQLKDSGAETIIVLENFAHELQLALPKTQIKNVIVTKMGDLFSFPKRPIINFVVKYIKKLVPKWSIPKAIHFREILNTGQGLDFQPVELNHTDVAFLQYTGGTTGISKGAILTHRNMVANLLQDTAWIQPFAKEGDEVVITALPLYHIFSLTANCFTFMCFGGLNILITNPRDINDFVKQLSKLKFTAITGVNTLFNALLNHRDFAKLDFSQLHLTLGGGMAVQESVAKRWQTVTGNVLTQAYGLTETSPGVCINPMHLDHYTGSIGTPIPSTDVIVCDDEENELPFNTPGELCVKGPQVTLGYWQMDTETRNSFTKKGWFRTGDIATIDEQGYVYIVDRKKDVIVVSGFNVYPNEVEEVIAANDKVLEVAIIGVPHEVTGEQVMAFVVRKDHSLDAQELLKYCKKNLTGYKVPKIIEFCDELPKTNVGKILRRALREEVIAKTP